MEIVLFFAETKKYNGDSKTSQPISFNCAVRYLKIYVESNQLQETRF